VKNILAQLNCSSKKNVILRVAKNPPYWRVKAAGKQIKKRIGEFSRNYKKLI
jgi:hypothetical protein